MNIRCFRCGASFELNRAALEEAVAEAAQQGHKVHAVTCVRCRHVIKVPIAQMRRYLPRGGSATPAAPETGEGEKAEGT